jgi:hypothetical protein
MAKKEAKKTKSRGHTDDEWGERFGRKMERVGKKFGTRMEKQGRDFGEEVGELGEEFGGHMKHKGKVWEGEWEYRSFGFLGLLWPIIGSIFTLIFLAVGIWILNFINLSLKSYFIFQVSSFLFSNLYLFFAFSLFFGYARYFRRRFRSVYWLLSPVVSALMIIFLIWIFIFLLDLMNFYVGSVFIQSIAGFLRANFAGIFILFAVLGYAFEIMKKALCMQ